MFGLVVIFLFDPDPLLEEFIKLLVDLFGVFETLHNIDLP
jgi:hypothetical protein